MWPLNPQELCSYGVTLATLSEQSNCLALLTEK